MLTAALILALTGPQDVSPAIKKRIEAARAAVEKKPDDATAKLALGKLLCFDAGEWAEGLPLLAQGGDKTYAPVAELDATPKASVDDSLAAADAWLKLAKAQKPVAQACTDRALFHYAEAWPKMDAGPAKEAMRERVLALQRRGTESKVLGPYPSKGWFPLNPKCHAGVDSEYARTGRFAVKLISPADPAPSAMAWFRTEATPCAPGQKIVARCWVLTNLTDSGNDHLALAFFDAADKAVSTSGPRALKDRPFWTKLEIQAEVPANAARFQVGFNRMAKQGVVFVDDFSLSLDGREILTNGSFELK
jgi:hypothetical protein